jgi:hypothetical protein
MSGFIANVTIDAIEVFDFDTSTIDTLKNSGYLLLDLINQ